MPLYPNSNLLRSSNFDPALQMRKPRFGKVQLSKAAHLVSKDLMPSGPSLTLVLVAPVLYSLEGTQGGVGC